MDKQKCSECNERDVFSGGLCSRCYGVRWRAHRKAEREGAEPKQLTAGGVATDDAIEGEIVHDDPKPPETHLVATDPAGMKAAQGDLKAWLDRKLTILERDIKEANAALTEARQNGWQTAALTAARNRAVDDETFYNKILAAVEAGHTIIPDFPISIFAVRRHEPDKRESQMYNNVVSSRDTYLGHPVPPDCAPAGAGEYRNPDPQTYSNVRENKAPGAQERNEPRYYTTVTKTGEPAAPIHFPSTVARSEIMKATADAMEEKVFDQFGVCFPIFAMGVRAQREIQTNSARAGDPLVIGQIVRKRIGSRQKVVSFIIAWHLNLNDL